MISLMNGQVYTHTLDDWEICWESDGEYRHWCTQKRQGQRKTLLVIMFNPGSLNKDGSNLRKDTTLRILREVCGHAGFNQVILNLFDYAAPNPDDFFNNWQDRDKSLALIYQHINKFKYDNYIFAYGDFENSWSSFNQGIRERVEHISSILDSTKKIELPKNKRGTPKHPTLWQRQGIKPEIAEILASP